jgi:addiction module RelE/StbE family toxin
VVRWSDQAKADLKAIHNYIARDSTHYAKKVTHELVEKVGVLAELPRLGRVVPELGEDNVREIPAYSYRILYEIKTNDEIVILAVIHKRRDLKPAEILRSS